MLSRQSLRAFRAVASPRASGFVRPPMVRSYAAAAQSENVKAPVSVYGIDGTYATALYTAAVKKSSLEPTSRALKSLGDLVGQDSKLASILQTPTLNEADKKAIVAELQKSAGAAASNETVQNFLATLAENNRLGILKGVCDKFGEIMNASRGEVEMVVISAQQLDNKSLNRLESAVSKSPYVGQGKKLKVTNQVNPDIIGGLVVEIGDRTIDLSVSAKLAKMNKLLTDTL